MSIMRLRGRGLAPYAPWGDSLTFGVGCSNVETKTYARQMALSRTPSRFSYGDGGVGGDTSTQIKTRFLADTSARRQFTQLIWSGRNNYTSPTTVKADIAAMVAALTHDRFLVLSIINGDFANEYLGQTGYNQIAALNSDLAALYGARYVDVRTPLVAAGAPAGSSPSPTDYANDVPPAGIRFDTVHLLDAGYAIVAATVLAKLTSFGW